MFCSVKDKISTHLKSNVVYKLKCPGLGEEYIGKSETYLKTRLNEHRNHSDFQRFNTFYISRRF